MTSPEYIALCSDELRLGIAMLMTVSCQFDVLHRNTLLLFAAMRIQGFETAAWVVWRHLPGEGVVRR